ncbi:hypothetical protein [Streptomyces sp. NPDC005407]|uniref:hypothetical protein n=1 Tax=Streptomyces sp. NPDC005407 TaxID=3155340 RepID=UPI0033A9A714
MPRRQAAKIKALQQTVGVARTAINAKRWHQARYALSRARAPVNALPADQAPQEREQLSQLRKKFEARDTTAAKNARSATKAKPAPTTPANGKKSTAKKSTAKAPTQKPKATPARDLADRFINRAALGYTPVDKG